MIKKLSIILIIAVMAVLFIPSFTAFADDGVELAFDNTDIIEDLTGASWNGSTFDFNNYPASDTRNTDLIYLAEYCYSETDTLNFVLYCYVYNPKQLNFDTDNAGNMLQLAVAYDNEIASDYEKFPLHFCSNTEDKLIYKYRVLDTDELILQMINTYGRVYSVSGIELVTEGAQNAVDYNVSVCYRYAGYAAGYGAEDQLLSCTVDELETVELDVTSTYYRTGVSDTGANYQNQVDSVYFAVDNYYFENYGYLEKLKACWYEYVLKNFIVTNNQNVFNNLNAVVGQKITPYNSNLYSLYRVNGYFMDWAYNQSSFVSDVCFDFSTMINSLFLQSDLNEELSSERIKDYIYNYDKSFYAGKLYSKDWSISADLFSDRVNPGRKKGYNVKEISLEDTFDLNSYSSNHSWIEKFANFGFDWTKLNDDYVNIKPIYEVTASDLTGNDDVIASRLLVNSNDVSSLKSFYTSSFSRNKKVILFRFANTDYFSDTLGVIKKSRFGVSELDMNSAYLARQTVFLDFDIIQLTFNNEGVQRVIPAVSSPIDVIADITPPIVPDASSLMDMLKEIGKYILIAVLGIVLLVAFGPYLFKLIIWIIRLPFRIIGAVVKAFSNSGKERERL